MKYVVCVPDGAADEPVAELGGRTPLEAAAMPNLAALAGRAEVGRAATIPPGLPPGSHEIRESVLAIHGQIGGCTLWCERDSANPGRLYRS